MAYNLDIGFWCPKDSSENGLCTGIPTMVSIRKYNMQTLTTESWYIINSTALTFSINDSSSSFLLFSNSRLIYEYSPGDYIDGQPSTDALDAANKLALIIYSEI